MAQVELREVSKVYSGGNEALRGISLSIADGELLAIVGPSGSGKSTLLRLIAGLEEITQGTLWIGGQRADGLAPRMRNVGMVFQNPALYPHLSVYQNIAFGLKARGVARARIQEKVTRAAAMLRLTGVLQRRAKALSGGERQRVALARAIAPEPRILLLDEPLSSLDAPLRASTRADLFDLHRRLGTSMALVTHDQAEALALGDRVAVLDRGNLVQVGTPRELYDRPATQFVAGFIGSPAMSLLPCRFEPETHEVCIDMPGVPTFPLPRESECGAILGRYGAGPLTIGVRAEHVAMAGNAPSDGDWNLDAPIRRLEPTGPEILATLAIGERELSVRLPNDIQKSVGELVRVRLDPRRVSWFDGRTGVRLV